MHCREGIEWQFAVEEALVLDMKPNGCVSHFLGVLGLGGLRWTASSQYLVSAADGLVSDILRSAALSTFIHVHSRLPITYFNKYEPRLPLGTLFYL